jgi:hypothetical protein
VNDKQGRLEAASTCFKNTDAEGAETVNRAPNAKGKGAKREMNTVKFWLEPALMIMEKPPLQSKFTLLKSKFFAAKIPFSKIQKKNLVGKNLLFKRVNLLCKGTRSTPN